MENELWKDVIGYEGIYCISNHGRISAILSPGVTNKGYSQFILTKRQSRKNILIATLVAKHFISEIPPNLQINHKDGNKLNNHVSNLEYVTASENIRHAIRGGFLKHNRGEECPFAKLTNEKVLNIRKEYSRGKITLKFLAKKYGVNVTCIHTIIHRKTWKHI